MSALKYEAATFQQILDQFPDFYEDLKSIIDDKKEQKENSKFVKNAIKSNDIRKIIVKHYNDIIHEDKANIVRQNQSIALKLYQGSAGNKYFNVRANKSITKKDALDSDDENEDKEIDESDNSLEFDKSINDLSENKGDEKLEEEPLVN